ncbi:MAG: hypothetical protein QXO84_03380 [Candidatus Aenigmatarchaeota archaeon]
MPGKDRVGLFGEEPFTGRNLAWNRRCRNRRSFKHQFYYRNNNTESTKDEQKTLESKLGNIKEEIEKN